MKGVLILNSYHLFHFLTYLLGLELFVKEDVLDPPHTGLLTSEGLANIEYELPDAIKLRTAEGPKSLPLIVTFRGSTLLTVSTPCGCHSALRGISARSRSSRGKSG